MSLTFTLKGRTSHLEAYFTPPIELDSRYEYSLALISLNTWNSIPNIESGVNKFYYVINSVKKTIEIPTGSYEIQDIEAYIQEKLKEIENIPDEEHIGFSLKPNNNTLKCELRSAYDIDFTPEDSIGKLLGFSPQVLRGDFLHKSDLPVEIIQVSTIHVECNIISGSYYTSNPSRTLYEFTPTVDPGYSINIEPRNLIFLPVNHKQIYYITLDIVDQN